MNPQNAEEPSDATRDLPAYEYESLTHTSSLFRIFTLLPSVDRSAPLHGLLCIATFLPEQRGHESYEAVSYVWGSQKQTFSLIVCGAKLSISFSLAQALHYIRHPSQPRDLWIDAICIDQCRSSEKSHQVRQMYEIFSLASRALIWLGDADEESEYSLTHLEGLTGALRRDISRIAKIFERPWWSRVWTFQEALAANSNSLVLCGERTVAWQTVIQALEDLIKCARRHPDAALHRFRYFLEVHHLRRGAQEVHLDRLVFASTDREATNPRDYVYGLLGLVNDPSFETIEPDYSKPASWAYQQAVVSIIRSRRDLDILLCKLISKQPTKSSWCANLSDPEGLQRVDRWYLHQRFGTTHDGATNGLHFDWIQHNSYNGRIKLRGTVVGRIQAGALRKPYDESRKLFENELRFLRFMHMFTLAADRIWAKRLERGIAGTKYDSGDVWKIIANGQHIVYILNEAPVSGDIYRALAILAQIDQDELSSIVRDVDINMRDRLSNAIWSRSWDKYDEEVKAYNAQLRESFRSVFTKAKVSTDTEFETVWRAFGELSRIWDHKVRVFSTDTGYIGSGSRMIESGDVLCILFGCKIPLVLRPLDSGLYKIIDAVYTDGIMCGEFLRDEARYTVTTFVIK